METILTFAWLLKEFKIKSTANAVCLAPFPRGSNCLPPCSYASIRQFVISDFFTEFPFHSFLLCSTDGSRIPNPKFHKCFISFDEIFSCKDWKVLNCSSMLKVSLFFSSTILKYWRDLFSLEVLKNAPVTSPTHDDALGGWYIYRQLRIIVFCAALYRQRLLKFFRAGNYR